jgi:hypothetical protein
VVGQVACQSEPRRSHARRRGACHNEERFLAWRRGAQASTREHPGRVRAGELKTYWTEPLPRSGEAMGVECHRLHWV